jgi:hypothetical protein
LVSVDVNFTEELSQTLSLGVVLAGISFTVRFRELHFHDIHKLPQNSAPKSNKKGGRQVSKPLSR